MEGRDRSQEVLLCRANDYGESGGGRLETSSTKLPPN